MVPIMLCSDSQHQTNYAHHSVRIHNYWYFEDLIRDNSFGNLLFMIAYFDYPRFCVQDRQATTTLDCAAHWTLEKHHVNHLITLWLNPIMPALCWHNKTTYYAQSNASILCLSLPPLCKTWEQAPLKCSWNRLHVKIITVGPLYSGHHWDHLKYPQRSYPQFRDSAFLCC